MTERHDDVPPKAGGLTRRSLLASSAGVATTVAVTAVAPGAAAAVGGEAPPKLLPKPTTPVPADPVIAYVHNAERSEVTVISGEEERTYRDRTLTNRLLAASRQTTSRKVK